MEYRFDDRALDARTFLAFVQQVWPGNYDEDKTETDLTKTINITARENGKLTGCLRSSRTAASLAPLRSCWCFPPAGGRAWAGR